MADTPIAEPATRAVEPAPVGWQLRAAWAASLAGVAVAVLVLLVFHNAVAAAWLPMRRLYGVIGLG